MDKSNVESFINQEKQKLYDIQTGLTVEQQILYNGQIREILMLLDILKNQKLNPTFVKKIENKIKEATKALDNSTKQENINRAKNYSVLSNVKSNIKNVSGEVRQKAQMVKASALAHDNDFDVAQDYLDQMEIPFKIDKELSNKESLVLSNPEGDVKVAYRGTKWNNLDDVKTNFSIITGTEEGGAQYNQAMGQINKIKTKYGKLPSELIGFSKGSALGMNMGEKFGIDTTNFNPFLGRKLINDVGNSKNTIYRTATDLPSIGIGLKNSNPNYDIKVIDAVKGTPNPVKAHSIDNFINSANVQLNDHELSKAFKKLATAGAKHGEAQLIADMASFIEGSKPIKVSADLYNTKAKLATLDPNHPNLGHNTRASGLYEIGEQIDQPMLGGAGDDALFGPTAVPLVEDAPPEPDEFLKSLQERMDKLQEDTEPTPRPLPKTPSKDPLGDEIRARERNIFLDENVTIPKTPPESVARKDPLGDEIRRQEKIIGLFDEPINRPLPQIPTTNRPLPQIPTTNRPLPKTPSKSAKQLRKEALGIFYEMGDEPDFKPEEMEVYDGLLDRNNTKTFTDFIHQFNSEKGVDTVIDPTTGKPKLNSSRMHNTSRWKRMWDEATDGDFTEEEIAHFNKYNDEESEDFYLSDAERKKLYNATPDERFQIVKDYEQNTLDTQKQVDDMTSIPNEDGSEARSISNEFSKSAKNFSQNLLIGTAAQFTADQALNFVDPDQNIPKDARLGIGGSLGGALGEAGILRLGGAAITGSALLPAAIGGGVGNIVGSEVSDLVKKVGGTELEQDVAGAATGVGTAVYTTAVATSLLGAEEGASLGSIFMPGAGTLIGAGVGGLIGLGAYSAAKGWKKFKSLF